MLFSRASLPFRAGLGKSGRMKGWGGPLFSTQTGPHGPKLIRTEQDWQGMLQENNTPYRVVDFSAEWCGPCKMLEPVLEKVAVQHPKVPFYKLDIDALPELTNSYGISSVPTVILFKEGKPQARFSGAKNAAFIEEWLKEHVKNA